MKKWSEIKQATLNKLFLSEEEARQQDYLAKFQYLANEALNIIANGVKPRVVSYKFEVVKDEDYTEGKYRVTDTIRMPDDFLSFADMVNYCNNKPYDEIIYLGDRDISVGEIGTYIVYYNALWENITEDDIKNDKDLTTHLSVIECLPTYIASQCLAQDDVQRSASLKNDFELMLSRLDTNIMYQNNHYRSIGGWY
jgi:hypothetical protein